MNLWIFIYAVFIFSYSHYSLCCPKLASGNPLILVLVSFWHDLLIFKCFFAFWDKKKACLPSGTTGLLFTLELISVFLWWLIFNWCLSSFCSSNCVSVSYYVKKANTDSYHLFLFLIKYWTNIGTSGTNHSNQ